MCSYRHVKKSLTKAIMYASAMFALAVLLSQCSSSKHIDWLYIIPDNYQGFLVIKYECQNGKPLVIKDGEIQVEFNADGTFCTSDKFSLTDGQDFAQTKSSQPVRVVGSPWNQKGYALTGGSTLTIGGNTMRNPSNKDFTFSIWWAGDMEYLASIRNEAAYAEGLDEFLESRFGVPRVR